MSASPCTVIQYQISNPGVLPENGKLIGTDDQELDFVREDSIDKGRSETGLEDNYQQPLIAPKITTETGSPITAGAVLLVILGTIATIFIAVGYKNQK